MTHDVYPRSKSESRHYQYVPCSEQAYLLSFLSTLSDGYYLRQ